MRFELSQGFDASADDVFAAYADPDLYPTLVGLPKLGGIEVLDHAEVAGRVRLRVRYRFIGDLPAAVTAVVDPDRLTWIQESEHDFASRRAQFRLLPDHYADRLKASGSFTISPAKASAADAGEARRVLTGELRVKALLVAGQVERAIVSGLDEYLQAEAPAVDAWLQT